MELTRIDTQEINMRRHSLPHDLAGEFNLLMLCFAEWQQQQCDTWLPFAGRLEEAFPAFHYRQLSVPNRLNLHGQFTADQNTRTEMPNSRICTRTLTLQDDRRQLDQQSGIGSEKEIELLLVQKDGTILWWETGIWTYEKAESLDEALLALTPLADDPDDCLFEDNLADEIFEQSGIRNNMLVLA